MFCLEYHLCLKVEYYDGQTANGSLTNFLNVKLTFPLTFSRCRSPFDVPENGPQYLHLRFAEKCLRELTVILKDNVLIP